MFSEMSEWKQEHEEHQDESKYDRANYMPSSHWQHVTTPQSKTGVDHPHKLLSERSSYSCGDVMLNLKTGELENNCQASGKVPQSLKLPFKYTQYPQTEGKGRSNTQT
jgi:hypothetical protein